MPDTAHDFVLHYWQAAFRAIMRRHHGQDRPQRFRIQFGSVTDLATGNEVRERVV